MSMSSSDLPRPRLHGYSPLREIIGTLIFCVAVFTLLRLAMPGSVVQGRSMQPSFSDGQRILISRIDYLFGQPQRGDIIVFNSPRPLSPNEPPLIKRVIGLPGDVVEVIDTMLYINGELLDEPYINEPCNPSWCRDNRWELGTDEYFVMGDNRNNSNDSRRFGPVRRGNIIGEALFRFWPPQSFGTVQRYHFPTD
jgi:signal peptidase I